MKKTRGRRREKRCKVKGRGEESEELTAEATIKKDKRKEREVR
jgi:hypothetical protein